MYSCLRIGRHDGVSWSLQRYNTAPCPSRSWKLGSRDGSFPWSVSVDTDAETEFAVPTQDDSRGRSKVFGHRVLRGRGGEERGVADEFLFRSGTMRDDEEDEDGVVGPPAWRPGAAALNGHAEQQEERLWMRRSIRHSNSDEPKVRQQKMSTMPDASQSLNREGEFGENDGLKGSTSAAPARANTVLSQRSLAHRRRRRRASSLPSLVFSAALNKCERHMKAIRKDVGLSGWTRLFASSRLSGHPVSQSANQSAGRHEGRGRNFVLKSSLLQLGAWCARRVLPPALLVRDRRVRPHSRLKNESPSPFLLQICGANADVPVPSGCPRAHPHVSRAHCAISLCRDPRGLQRCVRSASRSGRALACSQGLPLSSRGGGRKLDTQVKQANSLGFTLVVSVRLCNSCGSLARDVCVCRPGCIHVLTGCVPSLVRLSPSFAS